jgi:hypothetical protein
VDPAHWWQVWLPFFGSILVAVAAFAGVVVSNRTNREAIHSTRQLDHHKWLRETLLRLSCDGAGHAFEIDRLYNARSFETPDEVFTQNMLSVASELRKLSATADSLRIIGFGDLATTCGEVRDAADRVVAPANHHRHAMRSTSSSQEIASTRAAVDAELNRLGEAREKFVAQAHAAINDYLS